MKDAWQWVKVKLPNSLSHLQRVMEQVVFQLGDILSVRNNIILKSVLLVTCVFMAKHERRILWNEFMHVIFSFWNFDEPVNQLKGVREGSGVLHLAILLFLCKVANSHYCSQCIMYWCLELVSNATCIYHNFFMVSKCRVTNNSDVIFFPSVPEGYHNS